MVYGVLLVIVQSTILDLLVICYVDVHVCVDVQFRCSSDRRQRLIQDEHSTC